MLKQELMTNLFSRVASASHVKSGRGKGGVQPLEYHAFPVPRVTGSRSSLKVMVPVPDFVYTLLPPEQMKMSCFSVVPVLFNIGINEEATMAASKLAGGEIMFCFW